MKNVREKTFRINGYVIRIIITNKLWKQNSYLVTHKESGMQIIIDPGDDSDNIIDMIKKHGNSKVEYILLTHAHFDHIGAVDSISKYFNIPCLVHEQDYKLLRQGTMYAIRFGGSTFKIPENVITFSSGFEVNLDGVKIYTMETPGHTKGGVVYIFDGFIFSGDTLLYESIGRADLPGSNLKLLKNSVNNILETNSERTIIFSGHGIQWSIYEAKKWWTNAKYSLPQYNTFY